MRFPENGALSLTNQEVIYRVSLQEMKLSLGILLSQYISKQ